MSKDSPTQPKPPVKLAPSSGRHQWGNGVDACKGFAETSPVSGRTAGSTGFLPVLISGASRNEQERKHRDIGAMSNKRAVTLPLL